tara:strand:- start:68 stop:511 length:444 start_codon:yes stop_codon:yes gene_type:complete
MSTSIIAFPNTPNLSRAVSRRSFDPGRYPEEIFEAQNGTKTIIRYGNKRVDAKLDCEFKGLNDADVALILENYEQVMSSTNYVRLLFGESITSGVDSSSDFSSYLNGFALGKNDGMMWRYREPPKITTTHNNFHNVKCSFVGCQYAG